MIEHQDAKIKALEARAESLEEMAFSYAVLAEVSRSMNTFLIAEDMIAFALEIIIECAGFTKGVMLIYNRTQEVLTVKSCKLYTQKASRRLEAVSGDNLINLQFSVNTDAVHELELSGSYTFFLDSSQSGGSLIEKAFPGLLDSLKPAVFDVALLLVNRGELKGVVLMGKRIVDSMFQVEGNLLILALADLIATCLTNIGFRELAVIDELTKVYTVGYFKDIFEHEIERASCVSDSCALIIMDVDKFKIINDHYGHLTGDKVLKRVAASIRGSVRDKVDLVGRFGGDEFLVLLPSTEPADAQMAGERIRSQIARGITENTGKITVSIGISFFPSYGTSVQELMEQADKALYKAKQDGGNRVMTVEDLDSQDVDATKNPTMYRLFIRDKLTKFYVGPYFMERVTQELIRSKRYHRTFSLLAFGLFFHEKPDLDEEARKRVEDFTRLLCLSIIAKIRKGIDLTTRYSKEKILFLLPETGQEGTIQFVTKIHELLTSQLNQIDKEWGAFKISISMASYPETSDDHQELFERLLIALEKAGINNGLGMNICEGKEIRYIPIASVQ